VPNVLIAGLPAAVVSSQCVCAGPPDLIVKGSSACLIAGRPAARLSDQCAHGGMIMTGCPTVLIGDSGSGGGSAQASQLSTLLAAQASGLPFAARTCDRSGTFDRALDGDDASSASEANRELEGLEITMVDPDGLPVPNLRYRVVAPDGSVREGRLDSNGRAQEHGLEPGTCEVSFPDLDADIWSERA